MGKRWYGWQTLTIDAGAGAVFFLGTQSRGDRHFPDVGGSVLMPMGGSGLLVGAPIAHFSHRRFGAGALSLGMRVGLPLAGFGVAELAKGSDGAKIGAVALGVASASILDATLLAWKPQVETKRVSFTPTAAWDGARGGTVGVAGAF